ncbi:sensor histidine kinase [Flavobacterium macacae]|nr:ATP-binding protein [Flavobacterium macacae]
MIAKGIGIILLFVFILVLALVLLIRENFQRIARVKLEEDKVRLEHKQKLLEANVQVQEQERTRIAADIHDILIGKLTVLKIKNEIGYEELESNKLIKECITVARQLSHDLSLPMLKYASLEELISEILVPWKSVFSIQFRTDIRSDAALSDTVKIQLTRIIQELITNIVKHAEATEIVIHLRHTEKILLLHLYDNGIGFDTNGKAKGLGIKNIEFRTDYINAHYKMRSAPGKGTSYLIVLKESEFEK